MSALLIRHLKPFSCTSSMTVSIFWYETKVYSGGVQKLTEKCSVALNTFLALAETLGVPIKSEKMQ
jgi:hypothetical protein